ncbi:hypothetical protein KHQ84_gp093 [Rhodococcus phage Finch]|uniref:Uncharacterized protein n=1 Tax=Rhodococcus phage Finch TaxID=2094144 RepID=A0A2P1JXG6_9CAUD|nr:hypothetical protein KHQ84_gp093 [Rhodococcus phage Finch]AVO25025.1 hypothetical protein SEA_FINCH_93 [Rhodococcus phage Finch]
MLDWIGDVVEAITEELADYKEHRKARAAKQEKAKSKPVGTPCDETQKAYDEAVSLSYWLAKQLGEHVDDASDRGETLTDTVERLINHLRPDAGGKKTITEPETPVQYHAERSLADLKGGRSQRQINGVDPFVGVATTTGAIYYYEAPANCMRVITLQPFTDTVVPYKNLALLDSRREQKLSERRKEADGGDTH